MSSKPGNYFTVYIKKGDAYTSLTDDAVSFCEKYIKPVHPKNWDWTTRDFTQPENDPHISEARAIRTLLLQDMEGGDNPQVNLSSLVNANAIRAFMDEQSPHEQMNMEELAYALKVELEHGRIKDANVTGNHPFLTLMIVLAHMSESLTYYKRLKVMETEAEIFELNRKLNDTRFFGKGKLKDDIEKAQASLVQAKIDLEKRLAAMKDIPVLDEIED